MFKYILLSVFIYFGWKVWKTFDHLTSFTKPKTPKDKKPSKDLSKFDIKDATYTDIDE